MNKRTGCQLATMFLLGIAYIIYDSWLCLALAAVMLPYLIWHLRVHYRPGRLKWFIIAAGAAVFALGLYHASCYVQQAAVIEAFLDEGGTVTFQGEIYNKVTKSDTTAYYLEDVILQRDDTSIAISGVIFYPDSDEYSIGTILVGEASITSFYTARNEGNFDTSKYYKSLGYFCALYDSGVTATYDTGKWWKEKLYQLRCAMAEVYISVLSGEEGGILSTICVGEKAYLEQDVKDLFQLAGIAHILATSGLHISVVGMSLYKLLRKIGQNYVVAGGISFTIALAYAIMCGASVSATRAVAMFGVSLLAATLGEAYDSLTALGVVAVAMCWLNPLLIENSGFIFSFGAVVGVVTVGNRLAQIFGHSWVATIGIQIFTLPLLALFYYEIPLYSLVLNILLVPLLGLLLGAGLIGGLIGLWNLTLATPFLMICHYIIYLYEWASDATLSLPGARQILGAPKAWQLVLFFAMIYFFSYAVKRKPVVVFGLLASIVIICLPKSSGFEVDILDVDQGDGIYIQSEEGLHIFIDGGSSGASDVGTYRILPFLKYKGIRSIDYWIVTHPDSDHFSGLIECMEAGYKIENLVFATAVYKNSNYETIVATAQECGINIIYIEAGDIIGTESMTLTCIYPSADATVTDDDPNPLSLTMLLETDGFRGLFTGDLAIEQEELLDFDAIGKLDFLKVSHHGSNYSSSAIFLEATSPTVAVISCGLNNTYGHPGTDAVARLTAAGCDIRYTMISGQIKVRVESGQLLVTPYLN